MLEIGYWMNKMYAGPTDRVAFEIGRVELQKVEPDNHTGWAAPRGKIAFSNTGYRSGFSKTAVASDVIANSFEVVRMRGASPGAVVLRRKIDTATTRLGAFQTLDFSNPSLHTEKVQLV